MLKAMSDYWRIFLTIFIVLPVCVVIAGGVAMAGVWFVVSYKSFAVVIVLIAFLALVSHILAKKGEE